MPEEQFWDDILQTLKQWRRQHPDHAPKIHMIERKMHNMHIMHIKNLQEYHYRNRKSCLERAEKIKQEAEKLFKTLSKFELLATLSK